MAEKYPQPPTSDEMTELYAESLRPMFVPEEAPQQSLAESQASQPTPETTYEPVRPGNELVLYKPPEKKEQDDVEVVDGTIITDEEYANLKTRPSGSTAKKQATRAEKSGLSREGAQQLVNLLSAYYASRQQEMSADASNNPHSNNSEQLPDPVPSTNEQTPDNNSGAAEQRSSETPENDDPTSSAPVAGGHENTTQPFFDGSQLTSKTIYSRDRTPEANEDKKDSLKTLKLVYHGLRAAITRVRLERAKQTAEKMDHKIKLYGELGQAALAIKNPPESAKAKTFPEKFVGWRLDRRVSKKISADNRVNRDNDVFGPDRSSFPPSVRQATIDRVLGLALRTPRGDAGVTSSIVGNTKAIIFGPGLEGKTPLAKKIARAENNLQFLAGKKSAHERRTDMYKIKGTDPKYGNKHHKKSRRIQRHARERLQHMADMPITSKWRELRKNRAIKRRAQTERALQERRDTIKELHDQ